MRQRDLKGIESVEGEKGRIAHLKDDEANEDELWRVMKSGSAQTFVYMCITIVNIGIKKIKEVITSKRAEIEVQPS